MKNRAFKASKRLTLWSLALGLSGVGCTRNKFMELIGRDGSSQPSTAFQIPGVPTRPQMLPDEEPTEISKEELVDQLRDLGLGLQPPQPDETVKRPYLLCELEVPTTSQVAATNDLVSVHYNVDAAKCPALWSKDEMSSSGAQAAYLFEIWCGSEAAKLINGVSAPTLLSETLIADGALETACMQANAGKARYRLASSRNYHMEFKPPHLHKATASSLRVERGDGEPCEISHTPPATYVIPKCLYELRSTYETLDPASGKSMRKVLRAGMSARDLVARAGDRFYSHGFIDLTVNNWKGTVEFKNGAVAPEAEISDGRQVVRIRINGGGTEVLP